jgi:hypothetical protein
MIIDTNDIRITAETLIDENNDTVVRMRDVCDAIRRTKPFRPVARWVPIFGIENNGKFMCTNCKTVKDDGSRFCPDCGAQMEVI